MARMAWLVVARAKTTVVVHETADLELGDEVFGESVKVHFFEGGEAVRHYQARKRLLGVCGWGVKPAAQDDMVRGLEFDVGAWHFAVWRGWYGDGDADGGEVLLSFSGGCYNLYCYRKQGLLRFLSRDSRQSGSASKMQFSRPDKWSGKSQKCVQN